MRKLLPAMLYAAALLAFFPCAFRLNAEQMYIWDGSNLSPLMNPDGVACRRWVIWVYADYESPQPLKEWGAITGDSAGEVQSKWQEALDQQNKYDDFTHLHGAHMMGYKVHLGPICVIKSPDNHSVSDYRTAADTLFDDSL